MAQVKYLMQKEPMPALNSKALPAYTEKLNLILVDEQKSVDAFRQSAEFVFEVGGDSLTPDTIKGERVTRELINELRKRRSGSRG